MHLDAFMRSALIRKIGGIVGLLAILMTTLAPAASQMLERGRIESMLASYCSADVAGQARGTHSEPALAHLQACGYCNLAAHTPLMAPPAFVHRVASQATLARIASASAIAPPYAPVIAAQPRAPPSFA
jgi:hypothetical protein